MNNRRIINTNHLNFIPNPIIMDNDIIKSIINFILSYFLIIAAIALSLQAWINTNNEMVMQFLSPSMQTMSWFDDAKTAFHIIAAGTFFFGSLFVYCFVVVLTFNYRENQLLRFSFYYKVIVLTVSMTAGNLCFLSIFWCSYIADPIQSEGAFHFGVNVIGFCQYVTTLCDCLFCASFAWDYAVVEEKKSVKRE